MTKRPFDGCWKCGGEMTTDVCDDCRRRGTDDEDAGHWPQACGTFLGSRSERCVRCGWYSERHIGAILDNMEHRRRLLERRGWVTRKHPGCNKDWM